MGDQDVELPFSVRSTNEVTSFRADGAVAARHNYWTSCCPTLSTLFLVFGQVCDWSGAKCTMLQHRMGSMDGPRVGRTGTNKFRNPPGTHVSQRTGRMALDLRSGDRNKSASPLDWRDLQPLGGQHAR